MSKLKSIINYFELEEGYDKEEIITDMIDEIKELKGYSADEIGLIWDDEELMTLEDFVNKFYDKIIKGVCNVVKSFDK